MACLRARRDLRGCSQLGFDMTTANLLDFDLEGLAAFCERLGEKRFRATQLFRWIHQRGASDFAQMTDAVPSALLDLVHHAYLVNPEVRAFLSLENPAAARSMAERFEQARRLGLWHPRRNDIGAGLAAGVEAAE